MNADQRPTDPAETPAPAGGRKRPLGVVVGFDGSDQGQRALHFAAAEAARRDSTLTVMSAFTVPRAVAGYVDSAAEITGDSLARKGAEQVLEEAQEQLHAFPGDVTYRADHGDAAGIMVALSESADLAVVGGRGRGGFIGRVLGSVSSALPAHAQCPTVVVNRHYALPADGELQYAPTEDDRPVIVGVDGSNHGRVAALQGADLAVAWGTTLQMVLAMPPLDQALMWYPELAAREDRVLEQQRQKLQEKIDNEVRWLTGHFPDLETTGVIKEGLAIPVMRSASARARLTVVGTRGRGGITSALLGSVSRGTLLGAEGPVMVVPELDDERLRGVEEFEPRL